MVWHGAGSNPRPPAPEADALPFALSGPVSESCPRGEIIFFCHSAVRSTTGLSSWPCTISHLHTLQEYVSNSTVRLFADDTLLYLTIHNSSDCIKLHEDLNNLERWESDWQMSFHPDKCEVIYITTKKKPIIHKYTLHGHTLSSVPQIKYLGVNISQDLKWNSHINSVSSKANQTLGFLKRNLKINSQPIKEKAYKSIVRPKLEYCNTVWDPKCIKNPKEGDKTNHNLVYQIEMVQRRAARWVTGRYHNTSSVSDMLRSLDWRSLEQRRVDSRLTILYKIQNHLVAIDENSYLQRGTL